jgi:hypothetical protein
MSVSTSSPERYSHSGHTTGRRLELWVRPEARAGADELVTRAHSLEDEGAVETVEVKLWDAHQDLSSPIRSHREQEARATVQALKRWAWRHGSELVGFSNRRRAGRGRMGSEYVTQRVPPVVLAEYDDDVLVNVAPCRDRARCVTDRLEALAETTANTNSESNSNSNSNSNTNSNSGTTRSRLTR